MTWEEKLDYVLLSLSEGKGSNNLPELCQRDLHVGPEEQQRIVRWLLEDRMIERRDAKGESFAITFKGRYTARYGGGYQALFYSPAHQRRVANKAPSLPETLSSALKKARESVASWFHTTATSR